MFFFTIFKRYFFFNFNENVLHYAIKNKYTEIVKMLLQRPEVDVNQTRIFTYHFSCNFHYIFINSIQNVLI